jgi:hypothetical protein
MYVYRHIFIYSNQSIVISGPSMGVQLLLSSLPPSSIGLFYLLDGTLIPSPSASSSPTLLPFYTIPRDSSGRYKIRFRPASNSYSLSPYCTFSYTAYDGVTGLYALDRGVVNISVTHVNKPPLPTQGLHTAVIQVSAIVFIISICMYNCTRLNIYNAHICIHTNIQVL